MKTTLFAAVALLAASVTFAQEPPPNTESGFWVIESNVKSPKVQMVKFYNKKMELLYQEAITHRRLKIEKAKIRKALDTALHRVLVSNNWVEKGTLAAVLRK